MARDLSPEAVEDVPRPPPAWTLPDEDPKNAPNHKAWSMWNSAVEKEAEAELEERDPQEETDLWRSAARDIVLEPPSEELRDIRSEDILQDDPEELQLESPDIPPESADEHVSFDPDIETAEDHNAWSAWNTAVENEEQMEIAQRDPKAETDFWRSAAKSVASNVPAAASDDQSTQSSDTAENGTAERSTAPTDLSDQSAEGSDSDPQNPEQSTEIWRMARGVTGEMSELQSKLRTELERYNPDENKDQYRDIARELVGPKEEEPWENRDPIPSSRSDSDGFDAQAGSGWNPDVDWMRFEDMRREQVKEYERENREQVERDAREKMKSFSREDEGVREEESDSAAEIADFEEEKQTDAEPTFTDQTVSEDFLANKSADQLPGFIKNQFRSNGTYGDNWSGAEEAAKEMQEQGVPLKDAKADADSWRSVAKELSLDAIAKDGDEQKDVVLEKEDAQPDVNALEMNFDGLGLAEEATETADVDVEGEKGPVKTENSWSAWRAGVANWEVANEKVPDRDPKKEVDMWRASARELTNGPSPTSTSGQAQSKEDVKTGQPVSASNSAWDQWRDANAKWEASIAAESEGNWRQQMDGAERWGSTTGSDWGSSLNGKAVSERSAWEQWNNVSGMGGTQGSNLWWSTRTDTPFKKEVVPRAENNADEWRSVAREALNQNQDQGSNGSTGAPPREKRVQKDSSIDSWRSIAKDLIDDVSPE